MSRKCGQTIGALHGQDFVSAVAARCNNLKVLIVSSGRQLTKVGYFEKLVRTLRLLPTQGRDSLLKIFWDGYTDCKFRLSDLDLIFRFKSLSLLFCAAPIRNCLSMFSISLESLTMAHICWYHGFERFQFPIMPQLSELHLTFERMPMEELPFLPITCDRFPKLRKLKVSNNTSYIDGDGLRLFSDDYVCKTLEELELREWGDEAEMRWDVMFPNVRRVMAWGSSRLIPFILTRMCQIEHFEIEMPWHWHGWATWHDFAEGIKEPTYDQVMEMGRSARGTRTTCNSVVAFRNKNGPLKKTFTNLRGNGICCLNNINSLLFIS